MAHWPIVRPIVFTDYRAPASIFDPTISNFESTLSDLNPHTCPANLPLLKLTLVQNSKDIVKKVVKIIVPSSVVTFS